MDLNAKDLKDYFGQLMAVLKDEDLIRLRRRLEKRHNLPLAQIMADELEAREGAERAVAQKARKGIG